MAASTVVQVTLQALNHDDVHPKRSFPVLSNVMIGRSSKTPWKKENMLARNNAFFDSPVISREHAILSVYTSTGISSVHLTDQGSLHGTRVNGHLLKPRQPHQLSNGDILQFGMDVARNDQVFIAREYRFTFETVPSYLVRASPDHHVNSQGFSVPEVLTSDDEDLDETAAAGETIKLPYGSVANPVNVDDFEDSAQGQQDVSRYGPKETRQNVHSESTESDEVEQQITPVIPNKESSVSSDIDNSLDDSVDIEDGPPSEDEEYVTDSSPDESNSDNEDRPAIESGRADDSVIALNEQNSGSESVLHSDSISGLLSEGESKDESKEESSINSGSANTESSPAVTPNSRFPTSGHSRGDAQSPSPNAVPVSAADHGTRPNIEPLALGAVAPSVPEDLYPHLRENSFWELLPAGFPPRPAGANLFSTAHPNGPFDPPQTATWSQYDLISSRSERNELPDLSQPPLANHSNEDAHSLPFTSGSYPAAMTSGMQQDSLTQFSELFHTPRAINLSPDGVQIESAEPTAPPPNRRTKVSIPEIVESVPEQTPTPTLMTGSKRKADSMISEDDDRVIERSSEVGAGVENAEEAHDRPRKKIRSTLTRVAKTAATGISAISLLTLGALFTLPEEFFQA